MKRLRLHVGAPDLPRSIQFYQTRFAALAGQAASACC
jgi:hypothetical protein